MLNRWAKTVSKYPWIILIGGVAVIGLGGWYGTSVFSKLDNGGFDVPGSQSERVLNVQSNQFASQQTELIALFDSSSETADSPSFTSAVKRDIAAISSHSGVQRVLDYYSTGEAQFVSKDRHETYAAITLSGDDNQQQATFEALEKQLASSSSGVRLRFGGAAAFSGQINDQIKSDLTKAEELSFPVLAILLLIIFRSAVAAMVPLLLGGSSIFGGLFIIRLLANFTSVSVFVVNIITLLGLGLAIDYSLFIVSRFREELAAGHSTETALAKTLRTAGRTIAFSGLTVGLSLLGLMVFTQSFLRSMGYGGAAVVACTIVLALTVLPAGLQILGPRINALTIPGRRTKRSTGHGLWYQFSHFVMRHSIFVLLTTLAVLLLAGSPFLHVNFGDTDINSLPASLSSRQVSTQLSRNFAGAGDEPVQLIVHFNGSPLDAPNLAALQKYTASVEKVPGVTGVDSVITSLGLSNSPSPAAVAQVLASPETAALRARYIAGHDMQINVYDSYSAESKPAQQLIKNLRAITPPGGLTPASGGASAELVDLLHSLGSRLPYAAVIIILASAVLLFFLVGSVVMPIKAIILNILSLSAAFGLLVWIFQDGHLAGLFGFIADGNINATPPILIFAIAFGLAMDYEFFLLSRIKEEYDASGDNTKAVARGVQHTAGIITSAAVLLITVIVLFATSKIALMQQVGVGLAAAVAIDATIVRMLLVPAAMHLMGRWNWWAPAPLRRLAERVKFGD